MCKTKMATNAIPPSPSPSSRNSSNRHRTPTNSTTTTSATATTTTTTSHSSRHSLTSLRSSLPENPHLYNISEIRKATNNFLTKNYSTSTSSRSWKCNLKGKDVIIFQRKNHHPETPSSIRQKLSSICKYHHSAIVNLLGASISGEYVYLVYEFINGASLYELLHNRNNPNFTVLNTWMSRMQIATDLAHGLDYIHNNSGLDVTFVHNRIKSSSVIVTEPSLNAKICHFGTSELCNEPVEDREYQSKDKNIKIDEEHDEIEDESEKKLSPAKKSLVRSNSIKFDGTRGYMSPEFKSTGIGTRKSDIYAFGIILLELISGGEPIKYKYDKNLKEYVKISAVENAFAVADIGGGDGGSEEREGRLRKFVDRRLQDSYPVQVAWKLLRIALDCLHVDPNQRSDMRRVAGKISKLYLESKDWCEQLNLNFDITVSMGPR